MYADRKPRLLCYHDTWISLDPIHGCPYQCEYCVLRHNGNTGVRPIKIASPLECVTALKQHKFFVSGKTPVAIGNETDMLHRKNFDHLIALLDELEDHLDNPIALITKAPLSDEMLERIRPKRRYPLILFLSYSGLPPRFEPNFKPGQFRENFRLAKAHGFRIVHFWRPLLPVNSTQAAMESMLRFVSEYADATMFGGLKLDSELTAVITQPGIITIPKTLRKGKGEWLETETVKRVYSVARNVCPDYPLYRHTSCALANALSRPNHTATIYRRDICPPSTCPVAQREMCEAHKGAPNDNEIAFVLSRIGRPLDISVHDKYVRVNDALTQEEYLFLLHNLNYPLRAKIVEMQNLYQGNLFVNQKTRDSGERPP